MLKPFIVILLCLQIVNLRAEQVTVDITVETDVYNYYQDIIKDKGVLNITDFSGPHMQRDVVEYILIQQALALGGSKLKFTFTVGNYDGQNPKLLQLGMLLIGFDSVWLTKANQIKDDVFISEAIIHQGEYVAGVFTALDNVKAQAIKDLSDFKEMSVISNRAWTVDWQTLTEIKPAKLSHEEDWPIMATLVSRGWVDVMLAPFVGKPPFKYKDKSYHLVAVEGVKVALDDSRHFLVSKNHPLGKETFQALAKGLKILRARGVIEKAYRQSGFFNSSVDSWHILNSS